MGAGRTELAMSIFGKNAMVQVSAVRYLLTARS